MTVSVYNNLRTSNASFSAVEDSAANVTLAGSDAANVSFSFYVASLPSRGGALYVPSAPAAAVVVGVTPFPAGLVGYRPQPYAYGSPLESFTYYINGSTTIRSPTSTVVSSPLLCAI